MKKENIKYRPHIESASVIIPYLLKILNHQTNQKYIVKEGGVVEPIIHPTIKENMPIKSNDPNKILNTVYYIFREKDWKHLTKEEKEHFNFVSPGRDFFLREKDDILRAKCEKPLIQEKKLYNFNYLYISKYNQQEKNIVDANYEQDNIRLQEDNFTPTLKKNCISEKFYQTTLILDSFLLKVLKYKVEENIKEIPIDVLENIYNETIQENPKEKCINQLRKNFSKLISKKV